jgi:hypothetical protein
MIERVNLQQYVELADLPEVRASLPGQSLDDRLRTYARCVVLQDGPDVAIFQHKLLRIYTAVVFDFEHDTSFSWEVMNYMFSELEVYNPGNDTWSLEPADSLLLSSVSRDAGDRYRAAFSGSQFGVRACVWDLQRAEFLKAVRPARDERVVQIPPPLPGNRFRKPRKAVQASA